MPVRSGAAERGTRGNPMTTPLPGGVDCDLHPAVPHLTSLLPYMNDCWRDQVKTRGMVDLCARPDATSFRFVWRPGGHAVKGYGVDVRKTNNESAERL